MVNIQNELTFQKLKDLIYKKDNSIVVTISYDISDIKLNTAREYILCMSLDDNELYFEGIDGTEMVIASRAISNIRTEGFDPVINRDIYKVELKNEMILYISIGYQDLTEDKENED